MEAAIIILLDQDAPRLVECREERVCRILSERGYLKGDTLYTLEAAYQASRGRLAIEGGATGWQAFLALVYHYLLPLKIAIVYRELRQRYPYVREWVRPSTLIVKRKSGRALEVLVLEEGERVTVSGLLQWSESAVKDGHDPIVAIVDRNGQTTFYEARAVTTIL